MVHLKITVIFRQKFESVQIFYMVSITKRGRCYELNTRWLYWITYQLRGLYMYFWKISHYCGCNREDYRDKSCILIIFRVWGMYRGWTDRTRGLFWNKYTQRMHGSSNAASETLVNPSFLTRADILQAKSHTFSIYV